ncbi:MAG: hypothetical protein AABY07_04410 [Nanoarchaeota archaeon]
MKRVYYALFALILIAVIVGAILYSKFDNYSKGSGDFEPVDAPEIKSKAIDYVTEKLGESYVKDYISVGEVYYSDWFKSYEVEFDYNHGYRHDNLFLVSMDKNGNLHSYTGPNGPYQFIDEEEAFRIAREQGMQNPDEAFFNSRYGAEVFDLYSVLEIYDTKFRKGEIYKVVMDSTTGEVLEKHEASRNYYEDVSVGGLKFPDGAVDTAK